jgi:NAD-dependent dihydropyrimidine dehydrogenase PreA subunit
MVLYFSGTGNSKYIAKRIAGITDDSLYSINDAIKSSALFNGEDNKIIFSVPTYAWRIPKIVEDWIIKSSFSVDTSVYFVMNCGGEIANSEKYLLKLCKNKDFKYMGCAEIVMPENYLAMFSVPTEEQSKRIISKREELIDSVASAIKEFKPLPAHSASLSEKLMSSVINPLFYTICVSDKKFRVSEEKCISCGKCTKECPLNNVILIDGKPTWNGNCTHCMACITTCPTEAIEYGKKSIGKPRYRCPY